MRNSSLISPTVCYIIT